MYTYVSNLRIVHMYLLKKKKKTASTSVQQNRKYRSRHLQIWPTDFYQDVEAI